MRYIVENDIREIQDEKIQFNFYEPVARRMFTNSVSLKNQQHYGARAWKKRLLQKLDAQ